MQDCKRGQSGDEYEEQNDLLSAELSISFVRIGRSILMDIHHSRMHEDLVQM